MKPIEMKIKGEMMQVWVSDEPKVSPAEAIKKVMVDINFLGYDLLGVKPFTSHPEDSYLNVIMVDRHTEYEPYVCWLANYYGGFGEGHYFTHFDDCLKFFNEKGNWHKAVLE